jgi:hypothetical protein
VGKMSKNDAKWTSPIDHILWERENQLGGEGSGLEMGLEFPVAFGGTLESIF